MSIDSLKRLSKSTHVLWSSCEPPLTQKTIAWKSTIAFWRAVIMSGLVLLLERLTSPVGPLEAFEKERQDGTHKQVFLPDLLTHTGIPGSLVLFISHSTTAL